MKTFLFIVLAGYAVRCDDTNYYVVQMPDLLPKETKEFKVYWNVPTMQCKSKRIYFEDLYEKFGIIQNTGDTFRGDKISILYDPGDFPALFKNSTSGEIKYRNGGVPQEGDLIKHLDIFQNVLEQSVPDKNFSGVGIIDFESWKPILRQNFGVLTPYIDVSYEIEKKKHWWWKQQWIEEEAKRRFEMAGREFMQATVVLAKKMRPHALWGYYGYPYCYNMAYHNRKESCADKVQQENNRINWLWKESTALYPSVYSTDDMSSDQLAGLIRGRVKEAARVAIRGSPILPYFWYRYRDKGYFRGSDLDVALNTFYKSNASGFILWGSSNDVNTVEKCENLKQYITDVLGPAVAKYTKPQIRVEDEPDINYNVIFKPNNESKYDPEYTWIPPANYTQNIEKIVEDELKHEKQSTVVNKDTKESILVDIILHKIANYCTDGCNSKNKITGIDEKDGNSESSILLVTEDPFKKKNGIGDAVPTTAEGDIYDYDFTTESKADFTEMNEYTKTSSTTTTATTSQSTERTSTEEISTTSISTDNIEESTSEISDFIAITANMTASSDLSGEYISISTPNTAESSTSNLNLSTNKIDDVFVTTTNLSEYDFNVEEASTATSVAESEIKELSSKVDYLSTTASDIFYSYQDSITTVYEEDTISLSTIEPEVSSTAEFSTIYEESSTVNSSVTNSDSGTTLAPVLTEQVVVSVV